MIDATYLWIRETLPEGISYSEYAIDGTIWLTVALALTSLVLGVIFAGKLNFHARTGQLRFLAWLWTAQNLLLAGFAYHRLLIYIGFNGLTRWRTVGAFGITLVIVGLSLVARKIQRKKSFLWMVRRQLAVFALVLFALLVFPLDYVAHTVNTRQVLAGELGPAYQLACQPNSAEGIPPMIPLLYSADVKIREGVAGVLMREREKLQKYMKAHPRWTYREWSQAWSLQQLEKVEPRLRELIPDGDWRRRVNDLVLYTEPYKWPGRSSPRPERLLRR